MKKLFFTLLIFYFIPVFSFSQVQIQSYLENAMVTAIKKEGNYIWFSTYGQGIYRYSERDEKWFNYSTKNQNCDTDFFYTIDVNKDYLWGGTVEGLYIYDINRNQWRKRKFAQGGEMGNWIRSLCYDPEQNVLWIGRFINLTRLDVKRNHYKDIDLTVNGDSKTNNFKTIKLDGDSLVWFGTENGVHIYDKSMNYENKEAWRFLNNKGSGFNGDGEAVSIPDILFDEDYIWFATDEFITKEQPDFNIGGIYKYDRKLEWDRISKRDGLAANGIYCLARTGNKIWAGVYTFSSDDKKDFGRGLALIDRNTEKVSATRISSVDLNARQVLCLYFDGASMWIGTDSGLYKIKVDNPLAHWPLKKQVRGKKY
jgi:ligand-binding sensor domain-containing protein